MWGCCTAQSTLPLVVRYSLLLLSLILIYFISIKTLKYDNYVDLALKQSFCYFTSIELGNISVESLSDNVASNMKTKNFLLFSTSVFLISLFLIVFHSQPPQTIRSIVTQTHKHIKDFQVILYTHIFDSLIMLFEIKATGACLYDNSSYTPVPNYWLLPTTTVYSEILFVLKFKLQ